MEQSTNLWPLGFHSPEQSQLTAPFVLRELVGRALLPFYAAEYRDVMIRYARMGQEKPWEDNGLPFAGPPYLQRGLTPPWIQRRGEIFFRVPVVADRIAARDLLLRRLRAEKLFDAECLRMCRKLSLNPAINPYDVHTYHVKGRPYKRETRVQERYLSFLEITARIVADFSQAAVIAEELMTLINSKLPTLGEVSERLQAQQM